MNIEQTKTYQIAKTLSPTLTITTIQKPLIKTKVTTLCSNCKKQNETTIEAIYRQAKRGRKTYLCLSCATIQAWGANRRRQARKNMQAKWQDPNYAGTIVGKAIAQRIITLTNIDLN